MICDRCGKKTNCIYITVNHEKVCEKTCKGHKQQPPYLRLRGLKKLHIIFVYTSPKSLNKLSKSMATVSQSGRGFLFPKTKAPEGFPRSKIINRPQRHRCRFLQALCLIWFSFYLGFGLANNFVIFCITNDNKINLVCHIFFV